MTVQCLSHIMCITVYWLPWTNFIPKIDCTKVILTVMTMQCLSHIMCITVYWLPGTNFIPKIGSARVILLPWTNFISKIDCAKLILTVLLSYIVCIAVYCHGRASFQTLTVSNSSWLCFCQHTWSRCIYTKVVCYLGCFHTWCVLPWMSFIPNPDCQTHLHCKEKDLTVQLQSKHWLCQTHLHCKEKDLTVPKSS